MSIKPLVFVALPSADAKELKPCREMGDKPTWLSHEQIVSDARKAIPSLPDESWTMIIEEWNKFPRGAIAPTGRIQRKVRNKHGIRGDHQSGEVPRSVNWPAICVEEDVRR